MTEGNSRFFWGSRFWSDRARSSLLPELLQYGVAMLSVALALGTTLLLHSYLAPTPTPLFFAAVIVSAWYGGLGPGLLATVLSTLAINYFLLQPIYSLSITDLGTLVRLGVFVVSALLINSLNEAQRTARRRAEANFKFLRESEARFGCLAQSNILGMIVAELDGDILEANDIFLEMVSYTREELCSGRLDWRRMTAPESLEASERAVQELITTGACAPFEKEYIRKDGSRIPVLHGAVMTGEATVTGFVLDLSERKRIEGIQQDAIRREQALHAEVQVVNKQLETVLASINDQFLVLDREWRYIYASDRVIEVVGKPREELLDNCIWELFPDLVDSQFYTEAHRAAAEQQLTQFEYFYSPWQRWFENRVYPSAAGVSILVTDITERKQAQEKLQRTNQTLQTLLDACPVAIAFFDPQGVVRLWNRAAERIFGWSAEEAIGQFMPTVPHRRQEFLNSIQMVLSGRSLNGLEAQHQRKDGQMVDLEIWASLTHDAEGNSGCLGIAWDITERKQAEAALRTSEERYRSLVATTTAVVWTTNAEGAFICPQPSWEVYTGQRWEEYAGWGWVAMFHPEDREELKTRWEHALEERSFYEAEARLWHAPSRQYRYILARALPLLNADGSVREWIGMDTDIHDRKQAEAALRDSEERLRLALIAADQGLYDLNLETGDAIVSPAYAQMLGYDLDDFQETNANWRDRLHPDDLGVVYQAYEDYIAGKLDTYRVEFRQRTRSGDWKWILSIGRIVSWDSNGKPLRMLGTHTDITDRKRAEAERERLLAREKAAREEAETANRIKDEFLAVLSHELRSPLNPILGWSRLMQTQKLDEQKARQAFATIERNARLQTQLIEDLLDVSRILRGKLVLNTAPVSLVHVIEAALETVRLAVEAKGIQLQKTFNIDVDQVAGDAARLQQVVWNLLSNAVKFTPSGGTIEIRLEQIGSGSTELRMENEEAFQLPILNSQLSYAQIQVKDSGKGITSEFLPYVFDYFRQEDGSTTRKFGGLGLGLAIVRHITELHGGIVRAESPGEGLGATFTIQLPLMLIPINVGQKHESLETETLGGLRVLAVDDDADIRELVEFILKQAGAEVRVMGSAAEVLQELEVFSPEVLVFDIGMPEVDGYMLMQQIRTFPDERRTIPAIAFTAYAGEINQQQAMAAGFQMHLAKPIEPEKLIRAIANLVKENGANRAREIK